MLKVFGATVLALGLSLGVCEANKAKDCSGLVGVKKLKCENENAQLEAGKSKGGSGAKDAKGANVKGLAKGHADAGKEAGKAKAGGGLSQAEKDRIAAGRDETLAGADVANKEVTANARARK